MKKYKLTEYFKDIKDEDEDKDKDKKNDEVEKKNYKVTDRRRFKTDDKEDEKEKENKISKKYQPLIKDEPKAKKSKKSKIIDPKTDDIEKMFDIKFDKSDNKDNDNENIDIEDVAKEKKDYDTKIVRKIRNTMSNTYDYIGKYLVVNLDFLDKYLLKKSAKTNLSIGIQRRLDTVDKELKHVFKMLKNLIDQIERKDTKRKYIRIIKQIKKSVGV